MRTFFAGIDAGGTKTHAVLKTDLDAETRSVRADGANVRRDGLAAAGDFLADQVLEWTREAGGAFDAVRIWAGVAGAGAPETRRNLEQRIRRALNQTDVLVRVETDADIAFRAAFGEGPGILVIAGTGSIVWAKTPDGTMHRSGGWGYLLGDDGGGYQIGLAGLKALADRLDGGPDTSLCEALCRSAGLCSGPELLEKVYRDKTPPQQFAPIVIDAAEQGDDLAMRIVRHQALALVTRLHWLLKRQPTLLPRVSFAGSLALRPYFANELRTVLQRRWPNCEFITSRHEPAEAALQMALHMDAP